MEKRNTENIKFIIINTFCANFKCKQKLKWIHLRAALGNGIPCGYFFFVIVPQGMEIFSLMTYNMTIN